MSTSPAGHKSPPLRVALSTCPNDTFTFHALLSGAVEVEGYECEFTLLDIEQLNLGWLRGDFDIAKVSFHAALCSPRELWVLPTGSALGHGVGPLLLALDQDTAQLEQPRVLAPGQWTTAHLLYRLFHPGWGQVTHTLFSRIMPDLKSGRADLGICIHEGRFTFAEHGLVRVEDLGETWEASSSLPLPLGGIVAARTLGKPAARAFQRALGSSLDYARAHPERAMSSMRAYAQELNDRVLEAHVELYVNDQTHDLGSTGRRALGALWQAARKAGLDGLHAAPLEVLDLDDDLRRIFHLAAPGTAQRLSAAGATYVPPGWEAEGFIHLSFADQLPGTLATHYASATKLELLEVKRSDSLEELRIEPSRGGADFPHLYRPLCGADLQAHWVLERDSGALELPVLEDKSG